MFNPKPNKMSSIKILLVEDNEGDIMLTLEALKDGKMIKDVSVVRDGWEALQYIDGVESYIGQPEPDMILLDINLPKINGHEVLERLRGNNLKKHIPVVMLTTSTYEGDIVRSYQNKADCYISKPVDANDFPRIVNAIEDFWFSRLANKN